MENSANFTTFGKRELWIAGQILQAISDCKSDHTQLFGTLQTIEFNLYSGYVYAVDEDYNVAVMENNALVDFITCPECGHEDTLPSFLGDASNCCKQYYKELEI